MVCHIGLETKDMTHTEKGIRHVEDPNGKCLNEYGIEPVALDACYAMSMQNAKPTLVTQLFNIKSFKCR